MPYRPGYCLPLNNRAKKCCTCHLKYPLQTEPDCFGRLLLLRCLTKKFSALFYIEIRHCKT